MPEKCIKEKSWLFGYKKIVGIGNMKSEKQGFKLEISETVIVETRGGIFLLLLLIIIGNQRWRVSLWVWKGGRFPVYSLRRESFATASRRGRNEPVVDLVCRSWITCPDCRKKHKMRLHAKGYRSHKCQFARRLITLSSPLIPVE